MARYLKSLTRNDRELLFWEYTGTVLSTEKRSNVQTSRYDLDQRSVHHTSTLEHEFWIKTTAGYEFPVRLKNHNIPLREGQSVTLIFAGQNGSQHPYLCSLVNHAAWHHWFLYSVKTLARFLHPARQTGKALGVAFVASLLFLLMMVLLTSQIQLSISVTTFFGFVVTLAAIVYDSIQFAPIRRALHRDVAAHIEDLTMSMYARNELPN